MLIPDRSKIQCRRYPARRTTHTLAGGVAPIQAVNLSMGTVVLEPSGGQMPWHNQD
jgi:hypothetical protein